MKYELDPYTWYTDRQLMYRPKHFVITHTPITTESKQWVYSKLKGRFSLFKDMQSFELCPAFEDPAEAIFYELVWS